MDHRLAARSREIDPGVLGERLRIARVAAGLTQAEVAGGEVSGAYVSRIEAGQRRPEAHLLERFAQRLGTTLEVLLADQLGGRRAELELELVGAELLLALGSADRALVALEDFGSIDAATDDDLSCRSARLRGVAYGLIGRRQDAIVLLEEVRRRRHASVESVSTLLALAQNYRGVGDFDRAIAVAEELRSLIAELGLEGVGYAVRLAAEVAEIHLEMGAVDLALGECERALRAAEALRVGTERACAYRDAGDAVSRRGDALQALDMVRRALATVEIEQELDELDRLRTRIAGIRLQLDPPDAEGALRSLSEVGIADLRGPVTSLEVAQRHVIAARAYWLLGLLDEATRELTGWDDCGGSAQTLVPAEVALLLGQIAQASGNSDEAVIFFRTAANALRAAGVQHRTPQIWFELGTALEASGENDGAREAYRQAAASAGLRTRNPIQRP